MCRHLAALLTIITLMQGIQHLGNAMGCFMRMKGIKFHAVDPVPSAEPSGTLSRVKDISSGSIMENQKRVLPAIIKSEAVSISPVILEPATCVSEVDGGGTKPIKRQKIQDVSSASTSAPVSQIWPKHFALQ